MKTKLSILLSVLFVSGWVHSAHAVEIGDSLKQVIEELGHPEGFVKLEKTQVLYYERGRVEIDEGKVTLAQLVSAEEAEARRIRLAEEQALRQEELRLLREQRYQAGKVALEARMSDAAFLQAPSTKRIAYWETFKRSYPEVPLPEDYYTALRERELERQERLASERLATLDRRAQEAEERADRAEERAYEAERRNRYSRYDTYSSYPRYIVPYSTYKVYNHNSRNIASSRGDLIRAKTARHHSGSSVPKATYRPYESTAGYGFQRSTSSSTRNSSVRCGPYRASEGVNAKVSIRF